MYNTNPRKSLQYPFTQPKTRYYTTPHSLSQTEVALKGFLVINASLATLHNTGKSFFLKQSTKSNFPLYFQRQQSLQLPNSQPWQNLKPVHNPDKSLYALPQFITHTSPQHVLFLTQTDPYTPLYSCEFKQSLQLPLLTTQTRAYTLPQFTTQHAHNSSYSLPKHIFTLLLIPVNSHRACNSPYWQSKQSLHTSPIHNPHIPTTPLIPYTPPYSCESTQSLQLPLLTTQTRAYTLP